MQLAARPAVPEAAAEAVPEAVPDAAAELLPAPLQPASALAPSSAAIVRAVALAWMCRCVLMSE